MLGKGVSLCGAGEGLLRGMGCEVGGCASTLRGGVEVFGEGVSLCRAGEGLRRGMCCEAGERASRSLRACIVQPAGMCRHCVGERKCSGRACRCAGRAKAFCGEWVVRSAGLTHIRRSSTRARVLLYIRPPCPRREIAAMGSKDAPCEHPSPAKTSVPAPSAFALPRPRSHFPRPRLHFRARVHTSPAWPSAAPTKTLASRSSSYPQWVIHGKVIHIVARRPVQNVLALAPAHAYI